MFENKRKNRTHLQGTVVSLEALSEVVQFCTLGNNGSNLEIKSENCKAKAYDEDFFKRLESMLKSQVLLNPRLDLHTTSLILPDRLFLLDFVDIPISHRKAMQHSLRLSIEAIYKNAAELNLKTYSVQQTKLNGKFGVVGIRKDILEGLTRSFTHAGMNITGVTFASSAMVSGAVALNAKLHGESFLLVDIKKQCTRMAFVIRGCTMGYYDLPFGYGMMRELDLVAEDILFDHRASELLVLNAKERARSKQLTTDDIATPESQDFSASAGLSDGNRYKTARKLPKFIKRPIPQTKEEYIYENFRIIVKWVLELLVNNSDITSLAKFDTVYVNMPDEYGFLFDIVNKNIGNKSLTWVPLLSEGTDISIAENIELYGGFFLEKYNGVNTFE